MATESVKEFRGMPADQLKARAEELRQELFKLRTGASTEKVKDTSRFQKIKKDIARIHTILTENEKKNQTSKAQA
jgi:large subunit ribosomal protein L29